MGIDTHAEKFIAYAARKKALGRVATIGRQGLLVPRLVAEFGHHCEQFLIKRFHAQLVDSYDYSDYEGATNVVDLNKMLEPQKQYDTVIDCGCSEHVYNVSQALKNISLLCADGGQILHVLPANNFCGHGFWQFSPELFFSLYSAANGYTETEVFLADLRNHRVWYQVEQPSDGKRAEVTSKHPLYVMCRTVRSSNFSHEDVQQSDYLVAWESNETGQGSTQESAGALKQAIKRNYWLYRLTLSVRSRLSQFTSRIGNTTNLSHRNRYLKPRYVSELLASTKTRTESRSI